MNFFDSLFAGYQWYRRWRGGQWWLCIGRREFSGLALWVNEPPPRVVLVERVEDYGGRK